jgi:hypothetical protein
VPSLSGYLKESLFVLLVVVALAVFVLYAARRAGVGRAIGPIELLARLPLEPRRSVYVVRVVDQVLIIGSSEAGLIKLGQLAEAAAAELRGGEPVGGALGALSAALGRPLARGLSRPSAGSPPVAGVSGHETGGSG